ncbi:MAG: ATP-grasp domain-containing protein [Isosphaeraceae bacterium]
MDELLILGVSARAAAFSAIRCGMRPRCVDHFADVDLAAACPVERVAWDRGAEGLADAAGSLPPSRWFYAGGLENHPELVERVSRRHTLWGVGPEVLRTVRDPMLVRETLAASGFAVPAVRREPAGLPRDGSWLVKPLASGGGVGVAPLLGRDGEGDGPVYYQRRIEGPSYSALYIGHRDGARLVGVVRQWAGGVASRPFAYRGGIGPVRVAGRLSDRLRALGARLAAGFGLAGWFGVDFILRDGIPWPVEVNPRYTASVEIHELATGRPLLHEHRAACEGMMGPPGVFDWERPMRARFVARWIVYASTTLLMPEAEPGPAPLEGSEAFEAAADVPAAGSVIGLGEPVLTLLAADRDARSCRARLRRLRGSWTARLGAGAC